MKAYIKAISYYLPERIMTNDELVSLFPEWSVEKVASKVGVDFRHVAASNETAGDMAEKAARKLFDEYHVNPKEIDFVMLCTQSPDYFYLLRPVCFRTVWGFQRIVVLLIIILDVLAVSMVLLWLKALYWQA